MRKKLPQGMTMRSAALCSLAAAVALSACHRSPQYAKDQNYYEEPPSYYNRNGKSTGKTPTQRIESMGQPRKRVAILDFMNDTPVRSTELGPFAASELKRELALSQRLLIGDDAKTDLGTADFVQGDQVRVAQLIREGRRMGVAVLVIGRIAKIVYRQKGDEVGLFRQKQSMAAVDAEIKVFDVTSGREILAAGKSAESSANSFVALEGSNADSVESRNELTRLALRNAVALTVPDVIRSVEKLTWEGRVAKVNGNKIYVNAGRASGLVAGDILKVLTQGEEVYDPSSGAFLGRTQGQLKGTIEVTDFLGTDGAVTELHTGGNVQEGDSVRLY